MWEKEMAHPSQMWEPSGLALLQHPLQLVLSLSCSAGACVTSTSSWHFIPERRKNNNPPLLLNPICWLRQPPLTFVKSTSLQSSTVLDRKKWHGWRSVFVTNAPITSWRLEVGIYLWAFYQFTLWLPRESISQPSHRPRSLWALAHPETLHSNLHNFMKVKWHKLCHVFTSFFWQGNFLSQ